MSRTVLVDEFFKTRYTVFKWRYSATTTRKIALAFGVACFTGLLAQLRVPLPWTPVPITGQTFAVLLSGILLGRWWGGISQAMYLAIGAAGVPWFTNFSGGYNALLGPTGGYMFGFILASLFLGYYSDKYPRTRNFLPMTALMTIASLIIIYVPGLIILGLYLYFIQGATFTISHLLMIGAVPFIVGDMIKILAAASITKTIMPKGDFQQQ
jgi:biotin transport system substrate-specific component